MRSRWHEFYGDCVFRLLIPVGLFLTLLAILRLFGVLEAKP